MGKKENCIDTKGLLPIKELIDMVKRLPREERLKLDGVIAGMDLAQRYNEDARNTA